MVTHHAVGIFFKPLWFVLMPSQINLSGTVLSLIDFSFKLSAVVWLHSKGQLVNTHTHHSEHTTFTLTQECVQKLLVCDKDCAWFSSFTLLSKLRLFNMLYNSFTGVCERVCVSVYSCLCGDQKLESLCNSRGCSLELLSVWADILSRFSADAYLHGDESLGKWHTASILSSDITHTEVPVHLPAGTQMSVTHSWYKEWCLHARVAAGWGFMPCSCPEICDWTSQDPFSVLNIWLLRLHLENKWWQWHSSG